MTILDEIKQKILSTYKNNDITTRNVLRVVLGEAQLKNTLVDTEVVKIIKKVMESNWETIRLLNPADIRYANLHKENAELDRFLPQTMSNLEIRLFLAHEDLIDVIKNEKSEGKAIGIAMKSLKTSLRIAEGNLVKEVVINLRSEK